MGMQTKKNLRFLVTGKSHSGLLITFSDTPAVIEDIEKGIEELISKEKKSKNQNSLNIHKEAIGYILDAETNRAIQDVIFQAVTKSKP